nr:tripartite tricarboxylate transporter permease [Candidatus Woesearchaeota archaeon]
MISLSNYLLKIFSPLDLVIIILSMAITNTFLDSIPSIFLGAPDTSTSISILPGHRLLMKGKGFEAVILSLIGSSISLLIVIALFPFTLKIIKIGYPIIERYIAYILISASVIFIIKEKKSKFLAFLLFLSSGILGIVSFSLGIKDVLFPMLSGLFGISTLLTSLNNNTKIPNQIISYPKITNKEKITVFSSIFISSFFTTVLPGFSSAEASSIGTSIFKNIKGNLFLVLASGINTSSMILSIFTLYAIDKARNGAVVAISRIIENLNQNNFILLISVSLISSSIAILLAINITKYISKIIPKINYNFLCISIIIFISGLVIILSGFYGFLVLVTSTFLGIIPQTKNIARSHLMGCILLPVILYFI